MRHGPQNPDSAGSNPVAPTTAPRRGEPLASAGMRDAYPIARRLELVEDLHGHKVADPYRWLEDAGDAETQAWCEAQDAIVRSCLDALPGRDHIRRRVRELTPGMISAPYVLGERAFFLRRLPDDEHAKLIVSMDGEERILVDPEALDPSGTTTLDSWQPSKEGHLLAYQLSEGGTEESVLRVMDVDSGEIVDGPIDRCRYSPIAWLPGGDELFYVRRLAPELVPPDETQYHRRVYRHRVGTNPDTEDALVFGEGADKTTYFGVATSRDGRWITITASLGTAPRNDLYIADLHGDGSFVTIQEGVDAQTHGTVHLDGVLYLRTDVDAPKNRVVACDPATPTKEHWRDVLPETDLVLQSFALTDDAIVAVRTNHAVSEITVHDLATGVARSGIPLPGLGSAAVLSRPEGGDDVWVSYADFVTPMKVLHHMVGTAHTETYAEAPGAVDSKGVTVTQVTYPSKDGTEIRMFVIARDDVERTGTNPTILYGYGGFNISMTPAYSSGILGWVEQGGVYAIANLRGGSEEGEEWHRAGMRDKKQNVFDDFIAGAEWLIGQGYTSPKHLGISGGSNGGLLVGATLTQRPDLFSAVVCSAPLLDMVRYERFGLGVTWNDEYGTADDPTELGWLLGYSPYHNVNEGTEYPAVLFTVFEGDSRVDPLHARKLAALLQHATASDRPILFRREKDVGHGARSITRTIDLSVDVYAFLADRLRLDLSSAVSAARRGTD